MLRRLGIGPRLFFALLLLPFAHMIYTRRSSQSMSILRRVSHSVTQSLASPAASSSYLQIRGALLTEESVQSFFQGILSNISLVKEKVDLRDFCLLRQKDNAQAFLLLASAPRDQHQVFLSHILHGVDHLFERPPVVAEWEQCLPLPLCQWTARDFSQDALRKIDRPGLPATLFEVPLCDDEDAVAGARASLSQSGVQTVGLFSAAQSLQFLRVCTSLEADSVGEEGVNDDDKWMGRGRIKKEHFVTVFPRPLLWHKPSTFAYPATVPVGPVALEPTVVSERGFNTAPAGPFSFQGPRIVMGRGIAAQAIASAWKSLHAKKPLLIMGQGGVTRLKDTVLANALPHDFDFDRQVVCIDGEPTIEAAVAAAQQAAALTVDCIISIGGGSALDLGKAVAALTANQHRDIFDFLEVIGKAQPLDHDPLPFIAVPTTSGTGSEATKNAVLKSVLHKRKVSIRHDKMFPVVAIIDPLLTLSCPPSVTANVGMDTLCQVLEPFLCNAPNPFVDALSREGIIRASRSIRDAVRDGQNIEAREDMAVASVLGGLSLANARLGAVHGFAAVLGGMFDRAPHGAICGLLLPFVFEANIEALVDAIEQTDAVEGKYDLLIKLRRFEEAARLMTNNPQATLEDGILWLHALLRDIEIPPLASLCHGLDESLFKDIVAATQTASSTRGNPLKLSDERLEDILRRAL